MVMRDLKDAQEEEEEEEEVFIMEMLWQPSRQTPLSYIERWRETEKGGGCKQERERARERARERRSERGREGEFLAWENAEMDDMPGTAGQAAEAAQLEIG